MMTCPYPPEESLGPCSCLVDDQIRVHLLCHMNQPMDKEIMDTLSSAFACQTLIHNFEVNLHGQPWQVDFGPDNFGLMNVRSFSLVNVSQVSGSILAGAFNKSSSSLKIFKIEDSRRTVEGIVLDAFNSSSDSFNSSIGLFIPERDLITGVTPPPPPLPAQPPLPWREEEREEIISSYEFDDEEKVRNNTVMTEAFTNLQSLQSIQLGNNYVKFETGAFKNLPALKEIQISSETLEEIDTGTFDNLPSLKILDLSDQQLSILPNGFVAGNMSSLTEINLATNRLEKIMDFAFAFGLNNGQMPLLEKLILSDNRISSLGNNLDLLNNPDTEMDLSGNRITYLLESEFKPYVERRRSKGHLNMKGNPLRCGCDVKWILNSNFKWDNLLQEATCTNGKNLLEANVTVLERLCPAVTCPRYLPDYGLPFEREEGSLSSPNYPASYPRNLNREYQISATRGRIVINFEAFNTENSYDTLTIIDGDGTILLRNHSGRRRPSEIISKTNKVIVYFKTNYYSHYGGWKLNWHNTVIASEELREKQSDETNESEAYAMYMNEYE